MQGLINRKTFFAYLRKAPFGGRISQSQIDGIDSIIAAFDMTGQKSVKFLAYILATAFHETGGRMQPVREGFAKTDAAARQVVAKRSYGVPEKNGKVYYGRGHVQLTWGRNYKTMGNVLGYDLYNNPDLALDPEISATILVEGMLRGKSTRGDFTGKSLEDYFAGDKEDPVGARRIVNGTDKAQLIAGYYKNFLDALNHSKGLPTPDDVNEEDAEPDKPALSTDKTLMGGLSAVVGSGAVGAFAAIDSPWAFAAFAVLAIGLVLFLTGRLKIAYKAGV